MNEAGLCFSPSLDTFQRHFEASELRSDSLGTTLLEFESLTGVGVVEGGEGACWGRVWLAAVGGQHARNVAGTGVERRGRHRGGVEGAVQRLQERHGFVAGRDVLGRLGAGTGQRPR